MRIVVVPNIALSALLVALTGYPSAVVGGTHMGFIDDTGSFKPMLLDRLRLNEPDISAELRMASSSLKSKEGKTETAIRFRNGLDEPVLVYWLNYDGEEIRYKTLKPGREYTQHTYVTHPWIVRRSSNHEIVGRVIAESGIKTLDIGDRTPSPGGSAGQEPETPAHDTAGRDLHWAVAVGHIPGTAIARPYYGAAWNVSTAEEAEQLAIDECHKKGPDCIYQASGKNSCFVVGQFPNRVSRSPKYGEIKGLYVSYTGFTIRAALQRAAEMSSSLGPFQPVLQECVGVSGEQR